MFCNFFEAVVGSGGLGLANIFVQNEFPEKEYIWVISH